MIQGAESVPLMIVANKSDLQSGQRRISAEEGRKLAEEYHCGFTEASARLNTNVKGAFEGMIAEIERLQNPEQPTGGSKCVQM